MEYALFLSDSLHLILEDFHIDRNIKLNLFQFFLLDLANSGVVVIDRRDLLVVEAVITADGILFPAVRTGKCIAV